MGDTRQPLAPALTAEEWEQGYASRELRIRQTTLGLTGTKRLYVDVRAHPLGGSLGDQRDFHALAALCLYQQPFGFTHEDLELLNRCADGCDGTEDAEDDERVFADGIKLRMKDVHRLQSLASRIASLLPPRTP